MNSKYLTESARITDAYSRMYAHNNVNESKYNNALHKRTLMKESECGGGSFNASLKRGDLSIDGSGSSKTGSKLGRRPMMTFEKRDGKPDAGHRIPLRKHRQFEKVSNNFKTKATERNCEIGSSKTGSKLGVRKMMDFDKRDAKPTSIGRIGGIKNVSCVKGIKESEDFEMDVIDTDVGDGADYTDDAETDTKTDVEKKEDCCGDCKEVLELVKDTLEQIYDNLSDDDKALVDEVKSSVEEKLNADSEDDDELDIDDEEDDIGSDDGDDDSDDDVDDTDEDEENETDDDDTDGKTPITEGAIFKFGKWALTKGGKKLLTGFEKVAGQKGLEGSERALFEKTCQALEKKMAAGAADSAAVERILAKAQSKGLNERYVKFLRKNAVGKTGALPKPPAKLTKPTGLRALGDEASHPVASAAIGTVKDAAKVGTGVAIGSLLAGSNTNDNIEKRHDSEEKAEQTAKDNKGQTSAEANAAEQTSNKNDANTSTGTSTNKPKKSGSALSRGSNDLGYGIGNAVGTVVGLPLSIAGRAINTGANTVGSFGSGFVDGAFGDDDDEDKKS